MLRGGDVQSDGRLDSILFPPAAADVRLPCRGVGGVLRQRAPPPVVLSASGGWGG